MDSYIYIRVYKFIKIWFLIEKGNKWDMRVVCGKEREGK